ncbi:MAG: nucleoside recognition domain-containing protein [Bacillota bacterium]
MDWNAFFYDSLLGIIGMVKQLALIVFPLFVGVEIIDHLGVLKKISRFFQKVLSIFELPKEASLPLIIAQAFGLLYGSGLIIQATKDDNLSLGDIRSISVFFALCHAVFEDTLLFAAIGGNAFIILAVRISLALISTYFYGIYRRKNKKVLNNSY